jgi:hypothetical protein
MLMNNRKPADNERFCVMAAVTPLKRQCGFETLYPAGSIVETAPRYRQCGQRSGIKKLERKDILTRIRKDNLANMDELKQIIAIPKTGQETVSDNGANTKYTLLDFWRWSASDILSNATRGRFAEFIVGTVVGLDPNNLRDEWGAYDLTTEEGINIEVKSASYIQSWNQKKLSTISFSIKPTRYWNAETNMQCGEPKRHADLYVFCHLKGQDKETIDPLKMEQWDFYILPTYRLDNYQRSQSSITLNSLKKLTLSRKYSELKDEILKAYKEQKTHN